MQPTNENANEQIKKRIKEIVQKSDDYDKKLFALVNAAIRDVTPDLLMSSFAKVIATYTTVYVPNGDAAKAIQIFGELAFFYDGASRRMRNEAAGKLITSPLVMKDALSIMQQVSTTLTKKEPDSFLRNDGKEYERKDGEIKTSEHGINMNVEDAAEPPPPPTIEPVEAILDDMLERFMSEDRKPEEVMFGLARTVAAIMVFAEGPNLEQRLNAVFMDTFARTIKHMKEFKKQHRDATENSDIMAAARDIAEGYTASVKDGVKDA